MSESYCQVVQLGKIEKHPNADNLSITQVMDAYPCIVKNGDFQEGQKAVYISVDMLVPLKDPRFSFLSDRVDKEYERIKARKLRGIFSMGLLIPAEESWHLNQDVREILGVKKYEPEVVFSTQGENERDFGFMPIYTDIEGFRKYPNIFEEDEEVVLTEKIHGANFRSVFKDLQLWVGSHKTIKRENENNLYWQAAIKFNLKEKLIAFEDFVFFGEVYGQVQKGFDYGIPKNEIGLRIFDIFDNKQGKYLNWELVEDFCRELQLQTVPVLYKGPWKKELTELQNGQSTLASHTREGFVIKPLIESWHPHIGRKILKYVGTDYLLKQGKIKE